MNDFLGTDLIVAAHLVAHDAQELDLVRRPRGGREGIEESVRAAVAPNGIPSDVLERRRRRVRDAIRAEGLVDLGIVAARENLAHALILRLLTPRGALAPLGHADYGSRLHELIGERKTEALRNLCRAHVLEVVAQEPRVEDTAVSLTFDLTAETPSSFALILEVQPRAGGDAIAVGFEVGL